MYGKVPGDIAFVVRIIMSDPYSGPHGIEDCREFILDVLPDYIWSINPKDWYYNYSRNMAKGIYCAGCQTSYQTNFYQPFGIIPFCEYCGSNYAIDPLFMQNYWGSPQPLTLLHEAERMLDIKTFKLIHSELMRLGEKL